MAHYWFEQPYDQNKYVLQWLIDIKDGQEMPPLTPEVVVFETCNFWSVCAISSSQGMPGSWKAFVGLVWVWLIDMLV